MKLNTTEPGAPKKLDHIRLDQIGGANGLWWVARAFSDETTQPEGMFVSRADAEIEAKRLAESLGVSVVTTLFD